jgi:hypothetical protein
MRTFIKVICRESRIHQYLYAPRDRSARATLIKHDTPTRTPIGLLQSLQSPSRRCLLPSHLTERQTTYPLRLVRARVQKSNSATIGQLATENGRRNPKNSELVPIVSCPIIIKAIVENLPISVENPPFPVEN